MRPIIKIENIGKQYRIGGPKREPYATLRESIVEKASAPLRALRRQSDSEDELFWALRHIDLEVEQGEAVGIIGRNGAGKSTLLKILSRITEPTEGRVDLYGRIGSLLEVGTGFHPELTGRENIFLNGAILGMRREEIKRKFDEIVDFAGIEKFLETPVKRYSSGMYVRLAFAVAANLEPEILVVDEVLAVGDAEFQKKCLGKMSDVASHGRTVLFVSHNMAAVKSLCGRTVLLDNGEVTASGGTDEVISAYLSGAGGVENFIDFGDCGFIHEDIRVNSLGVRAVGKNFSDPILRDNDIEVIAQLENGDTAGHVYHLTLRLKGEDGTFILVTSSSSFDEELIRPGSQQVRMLIPKNFFNLGTFYLDLLLVEDHRRIVAIQDDAVSFLVNPEENPLGRWMGITRGFLRPTFDWERIV
ncbi:MAG TPA: ABC transporter ATP-binding protein [Aridibacter sp.]|nr:ABC transporter ATP-binding protein [Aridibacter sp.]